MSKTLLLEVQAGAVERGTLGSGGKDRSPGRQSALHYEETKQLKGDEQREKEQPDWG